jgi:5-formyltetrahydrofolate cyclo-ligase
MKTALDEDYALITNPNLPITTFNYAALQDRLEKRGVHVSLPTIIDRAKQYGYYQPRKQHIQTHDRQVMTAAIGDLIQHDSSLHLWSPYAQKKWSLITSLDDYSREMLYGDFVESESTWAHIEAAHHVITTYGIPLRYYTDQLRIFRFVAHQRSFWTNQEKGTDAVNPQWKAVMSGLGIDNVYALSPEAKGKIERPYRWIQDRVVRTCALEKIETIHEARQVLRWEIEQYNTRRVHSTTIEIPTQRFARAQHEGKSLFRPFIIPAPYTDLKDIFCLKEQRETNAYHDISLYGMKLKLLKVPTYENVDIHLVPNREKHTIEVRVWWHNQLVFTIIFPRSQFPKVHF